MFLSIRSRFSRASRDSNSECFQLCGISAYLFASASERVRYATNGFALADGLADCVAIGCGNQQFNLFIVRSLLISCSDVFLVCFLLAGYPEVALHFVEDDAVKVRRLVFSPQSVWR